MRFPRTRLTATRTPCRPEAPFAPGVSAPYPRNASPARRLSSAARRSRRRALLFLESLEDRIAPCIFDVGPGDTDGLIDAINRANNESAFLGPDVIRLAPGSAYVFTQPDNFTFGPNVLPPISSDITVEGNGAVLQRDPHAGPFRLFTVSGGVLGLS